MRSEAAPSPCCRPHAASVANKGVVALVAMPLLLAAACAALALLRTLTVATSLYGLAGAGAVPAPLQGRSEALATILVSSRDAAEAHAAAERFAALLPSEYCESVRRGIGEEAFGSMLDAVREHGAGLVSPEDAALLATPEGRSRIARRAARRYFSSPVPPLFPPREDPFCLADGFVSSLASLATDGGALSGELDGRTFVPVFISLKQGIAGDAKALGGFVAKTQAAIAKATADFPRTVFAPCGVPFHTAAATRRSKEEIAALTAFSILFIAGLCLFAFRSAAWLLPVVASLFAAASCGGIVLLAVFREIHVISFLLGTTVLGLVIDYSFHWLMAAPERLRQTARNLAVSFATTEVGLLPLALSSIPVLRQTAVFLAAALAGALALVLFAYPRRRRANHAVARLPSSPRPRLAAVRLLSALLLAASLPGFLRLRIGTGFADMYTPPAALAEAEGNLARLRGGSDDTGVIVVEGDGNLENLLDKESKLGLGDTSLRLSRFMPPLSVRRETFALVAKLYAEHGANHARLLGLEALSPPAEPAAWRWEDIPGSARDAFVAGQSLLVPSAREPAAPLPDGVAFCNPRKALSGLLSQWTREAARALAWTLPAIFAVLLALRRRTAFADFLPPLCGIAFATGLLGLAGQNLNLFHLLAFFLLAGMGVDYAVFLHDGDGAALKPALCSLLTSMAGFGALAFVSLPIARAFGAVLGAGLPMAFLAALATAKSCSSPRAVGGVEKCASPLGIETLYLVYRVFGLGALHAGATVVGRCAWLLSRGVRTASPTPRKVAAFARSLADKLVVLAGGRRLPTVVPDDSPDMDAFLSDVAAKRGVFVISSHCGTIEVLAALGRSDAVFHGWMDFDRTSVFNALYLKHAKSGRIVMHPISGFGPETVFEMGDALDAGDCIVMAADRGTGREIRVAAGDGETVLQEGAFRLAHALEHPAYFVACVETAPGRYRAIARRLSGEIVEMARAYAESLAALSAAYPDQRFEWGGR